MSESPTSAPRVPEQPSPEGVTPWRETWASVALVACVYLYVVPYYPALNNPNENVRVYMTAALVDDGTYDISGPRARWGWVNDAACVDTLVDGTLAPCVGGSPAGATRAYYSVKAPGTSFLGVPGYAVYRAFTGAPEEVSLRWAAYSMRVSGTILPTLLFLIALHRFLGRHTRRRHLRELAFFGVGIGSVLLGYAYLFVSHAQSAACAFGAFIILYETRLRARERAARGWTSRISWDGSTGAGMLAAGASLFEYPCFLISALLCMYALFAIRPLSRLVGFGLGAAVPTLLVMHFQGRAFGNPFSPGHLFVENQSFRSIHEQGFFGADSFHWDGAAALMFDGRVGMFGTSPLLVLGLVGLLTVIIAPGPGGRRLDAIVATLVCVCLYVFVCYLSVWDAGWSIGPRYLVALVPFLAFFGMLALDRLANRASLFAAALGLGLLITGFVSASLPSMYYPHLMPEISVPVSQLMPVLLAHDFAPYNAGNLVGWYGSASMAPLLLVFLCAAQRSMPSARELPSFVARAGVVTGATVLAGLILAQHFIWAPEETPAVRRAVAFVCEQWAPPGRDRATQLAASRRTDEVALLVDLLREEGRDQAADTAQRRLDSMRAAELTRARRGDTP